MVLEVEVLSEICPECQGYIISNNERGDVVCEQCGLVIHERNLDLSHSGTRAYTQHEKERKDQMGTPISKLMPSITLSTIIDKNKIHNADLKRAVKWNSHLSWENRNMLIAITELKRLGTILNFPERIKEGALRLYKIVLKKNILRGRSIHGMITACAYYVCKEENIPITLQEVINETATSSKNIKRCYKILIQALHLKSPQIDVKALIPRFCADLGLEFQLEHEIIELLKNYMTKLIICGKDPKGYVAGAIYLVSKFKNINLTQKRVAQVIGVTEVTLRSRYKELLNHMKLTVN